MSTIDKSDLSILHLGAGRYNPNDTSHSTFSIWRELARGFQRYTVVGRSIFPKVSAFTAGDVSVHLLASRLASEAEFLFTQYQTLAIADEVEANVVIAQCPVQGGMAATQIARRRQAKVLMEFHMGHYFEENPRFSRGNILRQLTHQNLPHAHRIRVLTEGMRLKLLSTYGTEFSDRVVVLPPRVDLSSFSIVKQHWQIHGRPKVILVGSVNQRKGQLRFLQAVLTAKLDIEVWIVGMGPDLQRCKKYAQEVGKSEQVKFFGKLTHAELSELLPMADALVMFSNMEGTPRAIIEGMAVGLPIITTQAGFCADIVKHDSQGFVLSAKPTEEVVVRLTQLFSDDLLRSRMGRSARERAATDFNSVTLYQRYRSLIRQTATA